MHVCHLPITISITFCNLWFRPVLISKFQISCLLSCLYVIYTASVARHTYLRPAAGVGALQKIYGGKPYSIRSYIMLLDYSGKCNGTLWLHKLTCYEAKSIVEDMFHCCMFIPRHYLWTWFD